MRAAGGPQKLRYTIAQCSGEVRWGRLNWFLARPDLQPAALLLTPTILVCLTLTVSLHAGPGLPGTGAAVPQPADQGLAGTKVRRLPWRFHHL